MNKTLLLKVKDLWVSIQDKDILQGLTLEIRANEIHGIMGPNGCGKSTFSKFLAGHSSYAFKNGSVFFENKNLLTLSPEDRSHEGLFLAFQSPVEIPGLSNYDFLRIAYNQKQKYFNQPELDPLEFLAMSQKFGSKLGIKQEFFKRNLNEGFSGGEKKKNEILQMLLLQPKLVIFDEIDSGLDIDALKLICKNIKENLYEKTSFLIITHYPRIFDYLQPDYLHIMKQGKICQTGGVELATKIEQHGYEEFPLIV